MYIFYFLWLIFIALIPGIFWIWFYRRKDRRDPEPLRLIIKIFLWGVLATIPAIALEFAFDFFIPYSSATNFFVIALSSLFIVAPIEEYLKYKVVKIKAYKHPAFNEALDGIIYCIVAALGFATFENILVIFSEGEMAVLLRFATATLMHALTSGIVGFHLGLAKFGPRPEGVTFEQNEKKLIAQGLVVAIILHGLYNIIASTNTYLSIILLAILIITMYLIVSRGIQEIKKIR